MEDNKWNFNEIKISKWIGKKHQTIQTECKTKKIAFLKGNWRQEFTLKDTLEPQTILLNKKNNITDGIFFDILEVYEGSKYKDTCISEMTFC